MLQPHGVVNNTARLPYEKQGLKAAATSKTEFLTCSFSSQSVCVFGKTEDSRKTCKAAARLLQDTHGVRTTDVIVRQSRSCLTKATRLPQDNRALYHKAVARMVQNV